MSESSVASSLCTARWKAGQAYQRNPIDWSLVDSMHDHRMAECMQSYVCLVLISVRDKVMVAGVFHIRDKSHTCNLYYPRDQSPPPPLY